MEKSARLQHVITQLARIPNTKKLPDSTFILCPFHNERTPSFRIWHGPSTRVPGYGKCYGCGTGKTWDNYAELIGCTPFEDKLTQKYAAAPQTLSLDKGEEKEKLIFKPLPKGKTWRGISTDLLRKTKAKLARIKYPNGRYGRTFVYLPVLVNKELKGYMKAGLRKVAGRPSFINSPGTWSREYGYFPFDYSIRLARRSRTVVLVEGQRDALRLLSYNIPTLSILGTNSWSDYKVKLLELAGIEHVVLFMDGDAPGRTASRKAKELFQGKIKVSEVKLWAFADSPYKAYLKDKNRKENLDYWKSQFWDPFNCPKWIIDEIQKRYFV